MQMAQDGACTLAIRYGAEWYYWSNQGIGLWLWPNDRVVCAGIRWVNIHEECAAMARQRASRLCLDSTTTNYDPQFRVSKVHSRPVLKVLLFPPILRLDDGAFTVTAGNWIDPECISTHCSNIQGEDGMCEASCTGDQGIPRTGSRQPPLGHIKSCDRISCILTGL
jgi:hypothetical protein